MRSTGVLLSVLGLATVSTKSDDAATVVAAIKKQFETVKPELSRYSGLVTYGETISGTAITKEQREAEIALFERALAAGLANSPALEFLNLGHNLIVHDPPSGERFLRAVHASPELNESAQQALCSSTMAAGELGEQLAVAELAKEGKLRLFWAQYLSSWALYDSSREPIEKQIAQEKDAAVKAALLRALSAIGSPKSLAVVGKTLDEATDDEVQAAALFAYVELAGFDGIARVEQAKPVGSKSTHERDEGLSWLRKETSEKSKHGHHVPNDQYFVGRFGDLDSCPTIRWLLQEKLIEDRDTAEDESAAPSKKAPKKDAKKGADDDFDLPELPAKPLTTEQKKQLFELLVDSKGFGLEAVKGSLFLGLEKADEAPLLKLRAVGLYSPNELAFKRMKSIGILVRHIREEL